MSARSPLAVWTVSCGVLERVDLLPDGRGFGVGVPRLGHLVGEVGVGADGLGGDAVEEVPAGLVLAELVGVGALGGAEVVEDLLGLPWGLDAVEEGSGLVEEAVEVGTGVVKPLVEEARDVVGVEVVEGTSRVVLDGAGEGVEEVPVIDDVAVVLVVAVEPVDAADGLEQAVVLHRLVDVEVGRRRGVEASEELVHDDEQLHLAGGLDEPLFD